MKERPILMSAPMVRAILDGTKTQTRRVVKPHPQMVTDNRATTWAGDPAVLLRMLNQSGRNCPYGQRGDRLWLREAWRVRGGREYEYGKDRSQVMYRATHQEDGFPLTWESYTWKPSIFMPRWASRITLEVTGVRVERLQEISEADAQAEGCALECMTPTGDDSGSAIYGPGGYLALWESINGPGSWEANPWVWVIEFRKLG